MPLLSDIARALGVALPEGVADRAIARAATLDDATPDDLGYITSDRYLDAYRTTKAGVVLAPAKLELPPIQSVVLRVPDAELAFGKILELLSPPPARPPAGIHPTAAVDPTATLGANVSVGPHVSIGRGARIADNVILHAGVVVGDESVVGEGCELFPHVVLRERVALGRNVIIHANATIGSDGFGYRWDGTKHAKIPQIGTVVIEDDVEIGSGSCVDRAKFGETRIGRGTKVDNLVQIGHNVRIGMHVILCGQVGLAGSSKLGNGVIMGGGSALADHAKLADRVTLAARAAVAGIAPNVGEVLAGAPAVPHRDWLRQQAALGRMGDLMKDVRRLAAEVERLKAKVDGADASA